MEGIIRQLDLKKMRTSISKFHNTEIFIRIPCLILWRSLIFMLLNLHIRIAAYLPIYFQVGFFFVCVCAYVSSI